MTDAVRPSVYQAAGGLAGLELLAAAWHARCLADPVVAHAFTHHPPHPRHVERLAAYWAEQLGGPPLWTVGPDGGPGLGSHAGVAQLHAEPGDLTDMNRRAVAAFVAALDETATSPAARSTLTDWFAWATELMGAARSPDDVPDDAPMPHWSWDGPVAL